MNEALISLILAGIEVAARNLPGIVAAAEQRGELTAEQAAAFRARMTAAFASPAWQTDAPSGK